MGCITSTTRCKDCQQKNVAPKIKINVIEPSSEPPSLSGTPTPPGTPTTPSGGQDGSVENKCNGEDFVESSNGRTR